MIWHVMLLGFLFVQCAIALHPPSDTTWLTILLGNVSGIDREIAGAKKSIRDEGRKSNPSDSVIAAAEKALPELEEKRKWAFQLAMRETIRAYDIAPHDDYGRSTYSLVMQSREFNGQVKPWIVLYKEPEARVVSGKSGLLDWPDAENEQDRQMALNKARGENDGVTLGDGLTMIWPKVGTPLELAQLLLHERVHFELYADPVWAKKGAAACEVEALRRVRGSIPELTEDPRQRLLLDGVLERKIQNAEVVVAMERRENPLVKMRRRLRRTLPYGFSELESSIPDVFFDPKEVANIRQEAENINARLDAQAAERRAEEAVRKRQDDSVREEDRRLLRRRELWDEMRFLASQFCGFRAFPESLLERWRVAVGEIDVEGLIPDLSKTEGRFECAGYVANQARVAKWRGLSPGAEEWLEAAVREGLRRETDPWPAGLPRAVQPDELPRAVLPPRAVQPTQPPSGGQPTVQPPLGETQLPERPRCRYQGDWCQ